MAHVQICNPQTNEVRTVPEAAVPYFPGFELVKAEPKKSAERGADKKES